MGDTKEFHQLSSEHGGIEAGSKVTLNKDHREFGKDLAAGSVLTVNSIIHFPTRYRVKDDTGNIWTVPVHSVNTSSDAPDSEPESETAVEEDG